MTTLTIRNVDETLRRKLKARAAANGRSMEAELRVIIATAAEAMPPTHNVGRAVHARFAGIGGVELEIPDRSPARALPRL